MVSERALSRRIVNKLRRQYWHVQPIEDKLACGVPDLNLCKNGFECWLELKVATRTRAGTIKLGLRPNQMAWAKDRTAAGGNWRLLIGEKSTEDFLLLDWSFIRTTADLQKGVILYDACVPMTFDEVINELNRLSEVVHERRI